MHNPLAVCFYHPADVVEQVDHGHDVLGEGHADAEGRSVVDRLVDEPEIQHGLVDAHVEFAFLVFILGFDWGLEH